MKLAIATPFYSLTGFSPYIVSLTQSLKLLDKLKVDWEFWDYSGDTYVDRARNILVHRFYKSDRTDLIFIDSDMSWDLQGFYNLLNSPKELTAGVYPTKNKFDTFCASVKYDENHAPVQDIETGLIEADWLPTGFMKITKSCIEKLYEEHKDEYFLVDDEKIVSLFECYVNKSHQRAGEDVTFCLKWTALGNKCYIEPRINFSHCGLKQWEGNFHEHLSLQAEQFRITSAINSITEEVQLDGGPYKPMDSAQEPILDQRD
jgi:hypothetical protein